MLSPSDLRPMFDIWPMLEFGPKYNVNLLALLLFQNPMYILELKGSRQIFETNIFFLEPL